MNLQICVSFIASHQTLRQTQGMWLSGWGSFSLNQKSKVRSSPLSLCLRSNERLTTAFSGEYPGLDQKSQTLRRGFATVVVVGNLESEKLVEKINRRGDCVTYYTLVTDELSRAVQLLDQMRRVKKGLSPSKTNYTSLIDSLCKDDRIDEAYRVLNEMILSGFSTTSDVPLNNIIRGFLRLGEMKADYYYSVTYNNLISEMCKAKELTHAVELLDHMRRVKGLNPNETTFISLIDFLCKQDRIDEAYSVLNEMFLCRFSPSVATLNDVLAGFLRIGETGKAYEMFKKMNQRMRIWWNWMDKDTESSFKQGFSDGVTYTSLMNAYLDEGNLFKVDNLLYHMKQFDCLPETVRNSVFINGLDKKDRTTNTMRYLLRFHYNKYVSNPTLEYRRTLAVNSNDDEFKSLVELVEGFCNMGLENAYDTMLKWNYKPDGIIYNLFIIEHCKRDNTDQAYNMYKEMVHYGFSCHMFIVFVLVQSLNWNAMINEIRWVVQNVLRSCNLNDSEILKFLDEFNPKKPDSEALFNVLAEKAKDGLFLNCSYVPPNA